MNRIFALGAALLCAASALADEPEKLELDFGGTVQYDFRVRPTPGKYGTYYHPVADVPGIERNELLFKTRLSARLSKFGMKSDVDLIFRAYPQAQNLNELSEYNQLKPIRIEAHDLFVYARDLGLKGFDLQIGQQKAMFGVGDQFNPTNTVNPNRLEDILLFGEQMGNLMIRADYSPIWNLQFTGILVPIFMPALLPRTAYLAQTPDRFPFLNDELRYNLNAEAAAGEQLFGYPTIVRSVAIEHPEFHPRNFQGFFRVGTTLGGQDIALSYYRGFSDIPQPVRNTTSQVRQQICENPNNPDSACVNGLLASDVTLSFPRMQVIGLNMAGEMNPFGKIHKSFKSIGYRIEAALIIPEEQRLTVMEDDIQFGFVTRNGEYPYPNGDNRVIDSRPFGKWVLGLDYTFNRHLYMNTQWVHGFIDEFGAGDWIQPGYQVRASGLVPGIEALGTRCLDLATFSGRGESCAREWLKPRIGDYLVVGLDIKFLSQSALIRLFTIWDLVGVYESTWNDGSGERELIHHSMFTKEGFSAVLYPAFQYNFGNGLEMHLGGLVQLGQRWSKFGAPETGGHMVWSRARYRF